jgi:glycerol-3-phosphate dehydrogenase
MDPPLNRARFLAEIARDPRFDALIIGGGIAGAATFRDLSAQGLRCLVVERDDFANGVSGALTRVAQGGFTYLQKSEIGRVRRAVLERNRFVAAAPHQIRPVRIVAPTERFASGALSATLRAFGLAEDRSLPGALVLRAAIALCEGLGRGAKVLPRGGFVGRARLRRRYPGISSRYVAAVYNYEALIASPERLAIELVEDGVRQESGSAALNYSETRVEGARLVVEDRRVGRRYAVEAGVVVNAAGANVDRVARTFGVEAKMVDEVACAQLILRSPGIASALGDDLFLFEGAAANSSQRRLCVVYPVGENILLGAAEARGADPVLSRSTAQDDEYLLAALRGLFPAAEVTREHIIERPHAVRPIVALSGGDLTGRGRDHVIHTHASAPTLPPLVSIAGGESTTFRAIAEEAADAALKALGRERRVSTVGLAIGDGANANEVSNRALALDYGLGERFAKRLVSIYGSRAARVAAYLTTSDARRTIRGSAVTWGEIAFFVCEELAMTAEDVARRRTRLAFESRATPAALAEIEKALVRGAVLAGVPGERQRHASV